MGFWNRKKKQESLEVQVETEQKKKALGFSEREIVLYWACKAYEDENIVLMTDINLATKTSDYWYKIPEAIRFELRKEVVILFCKDEQEVRKVTEAMSPKFSNAYGICLGKVLYWNEDGL